MATTSDITWDDVPYEYLLCVHTACPMAASCLRAIAFSLLPDGRQSARIVNPNTCAQAPDCANYKCSEPRSYALGFTRLQESLLPRQYKRLMACLMRQWSRNEYFRRRRGERPMPPGEQELVRRALSDIGAPADLDFDDYITLIPWDD